MPHFRGKSTNESHKLWHTAWHGLGHGAGLGEVGQREFWSIVRAQLNQVRQQFNWVGAEAAIKFST